MMLRQNWINCSSVLVLRHIMREFPMLHEDAHEDYITWMKIIQTYGSAYGVNEVLLKYRLTGKGKSGSKWKSAQDDGAHTSISDLEIIKFVLFSSYMLHGI